MILAVSTYTAPLEQVAASREEHLAFLAQLTEAGVLVTAGRQDPPEGGVLVLRGDEPAVVERLLADDPYAQRGLARYRVTAFRAVAGQLQD